jgi:hypothetical protein
MKRAVLVYQGGIANVFEVECFNLCDYGRGARRLVQSDFRACEWFARGLDRAGVLVTTMQCNQAGEIAASKWSDDLEAAPFSDKFKPVFSKGVLATA